MTSGPTRSPNGGGAGLLPPHAVTSTAAMQLLLAPVMRLPERVEYLRRVAIRIQGQLRIALEHVLERRDRERLVVIGDVRRGEEHADIGRGLRGEKIAIVLLEI